MPNTTKRTPRPRPCTTAPRREPDTIADLLPFAPHTHSTAERLLSAAEVCAANCFQDVAALLLQEYSAKVSARAWISDSDSERVLRLAARLQELPS